MKERLASPATLKIKRWGKEAVRKVGLPIAQRFWNAVPDAIHHPSPAVMAIALTRICNADCTFCAYQFLEKDDRINMPDAMFDDIVAQVAELGIRNVQLAPNLGDPLVAPRFLEKCDKLRAAGVTFMSLSTNAILLDKIGVDAFLERGPNEIYISTTVFDEEMYRRLYRSKQYERMRRNVLDLLRKNSELPRAKRRYINLRLRTDKPVEEFQGTADWEECERLADEIEFNAAYSDWGGLISPRMLTGTMAFEKTSPHTNRPCRQLFYMAVHPDGEILACACRNVHHEKAMSLGYLADINLRTAWGRLGGITEAWRNGSIPNTCATCSMYNDPAEAWLGAVRSAAGSLLTSITKRAV